MNFAEALGMPSLRQEWPSIWSALPARLAILNACRRALTVIASLLAMGGGAFAAEALDVLATGSGVRFGIWPQRPQKPAPTIFVLAGTI